MSEARKRHPLREAWRSSDFRRIVLAVAASVAGDWMYGTALVVYVYEQTGSPAWVAAAGIFRLLPYIVVGPFAGALSDRFDRRRVMIVSDLARAVLMAALAVFAAASAPASVVVLLAFLSTAAGTPFAPAMTGLTPTLVEEKELAAANAGLSTVEHTALVVGPALGGLILIAGPAWVAFGANAVTFVISAALLARIRARRAVTRSSEEEASLLTEIREGVRAATSSAAVSIPVALYALASLAYGFQIVLFVLVAERLLDIGAEGVGFLNASIGVGGVAAAGISSRLASNTRTGRSLALGVVCFGMPIAILAMIGQPFIAYLLIAIAGAGSILLDVTTVTLLQRLVDERVLARVFSILDSVAVAAILAGSLAAPVLVAAVGVRPTLLIAGLLVPAVTLALGPTIARLDRTAAQRAVELGPSVELLERTGIFPGVSRGSLEQLAAQAALRSVRAGDVVVTEGEPADNFYVVATGGFHASSETTGKAVVLSQMTAGDYFGEIGILEKMPRTATVRATEDSEVLVISGDAFLAAVNRPTGMSPALAGGVAARLARTHPSYEPVTVER